MELLSWADLAGLTLGRQFAPDFDEQPPPVAELVARTGAIQSQTARSTFLGLGARARGTTHQAITDAFESHAIVRGSLLRGTVHTCTAQDHQWLDAVTQIQMLRYWNRILDTESVDPQTLWASIEEHARQEWRTPAELRAHLRSVLLDIDPRFQEQLDTEPGKYLGFSHGGLVRRPLKGGWQGQGAPGYRSAAAVLGRASAHTLDPSEATDQLLQRHLRWHGPANRRDLAWWSGLRLTEVDASLARLADTLTKLQGPTHDPYWDVRDPAPPRDDVGIRLLPEFDSLLCAYHPRQRDRFVTPTHHATLWNQANGLLSAPVLIGQRLLGAWRMTGSDQRKALQITVFAGRTPARSRFDTAIHAVETAMQLTVTQVELLR